jgi:hypothetical protein
VFWINLSKTGFKIFSVRLMVTLSDYELADVHFRNNDRQSPQPEPHADAVYAWDSEVMPLVRIDLGQGQPAEYRRRIGEMVYQAMLETIQGPTAHAIEVPKGAEHFGSACFQI